VLPLDSQGRLLITGKNGVGKTNIGELLFYAFYCKTRKSGRSNAVINRHARRHGEGMKIEVLFDVHNGEQKDRYRLHNTQGWHTKGRDGKPPKNGVRMWRKEDKHWKLVTPVNDPRLAKEMVEQTIGITADEFCSIVYLPQRMVHPLATGTPGSRAKYITEAYNLNRYDDLLQRAKNEKAVAGESLGEREGILAEIKVITRQARELPDEETIKEKYENYQAIIESCDEDAEGVDEDLGTLARRKELVRRREEIKRKLARWRQDHPGDIDPDDISVRLTRARKRLRKLTQAIPQLERRAELENDLQAAQSKLQRITLPEGKTTNQVVIKMTKRRSVLAERLRITRFLARGDESNCPSCGQDIKDSIREAARAFLKKDQQRIEELDQNIRKARSGLIAINKHKALTETVTSIKGDLLDLPTGDLAAVEERAEGIEQEIEDLERQRDNALSLVAMTQEIKNLPRYKMSSLRKKEAKLLAESRRIQKRRDRAADDIVVVREGLKQSRRWAAAIKEARADLKETERAARRHRVMEGLVAAFGNKGIKLHRMRNIVSAVAERLPVYTQRLLPHYTFMLAEKETGLNFEYTDDRDPDGIPCDIAALSEGEKVRLSVCLMMAEQSIRTVRVNVLFLDEFDGGLDKDGSEALVEVLREMEGQGNYSTIVAVSHSEHVQGSGGFSRHLAVSRRGTYSRMKDKGR